MFQRRCHKIMPFLPRGFLTATRPLLPFVLPRIHNNNNNNMEDTDMILVVAMADTTTTAMVDTIQRERSYSSSREGKFLLLLHPSMPVPKNLFPGVSILEAQTKKFYYICTVLCTILVSSSIIGMPVYQYTSGLKIPYPSYSSLEYSLFCRLPFQQRIGK